MCNYRQAKLYYQKALESGFNSPILLNNLGYCCLQLGDLDRAEECLKQAVEVDDGLQAAHHNLVMLALRRSAIEQSDSSWAIVHAEKAIEIGPVSYSLYLHVGVLHVLTAKDDRNKHQQVILCLEKAIDYGLEPGELTAWAAFSSCQDEAGFTILLTRPVGRRLEADYLVDPL